MTKSSPEKLAKALRANLKKRKAGPGSGTGANTANKGKPPAELPESGPKQAGSPPRRAPKD